MLPIPTVDFLLNNSSNSWTIQATLVFDTPLAASKCHKWYGTIIKNLTISTENADKYSLIVSGAVAIVNATGLTGSIDGENDTMVPGQIYLVTGSVPPSDPYVSGSAQSNIIDQGEW